MENKQLWTWLESLIWCPSQIEYYFKDSNGSNYLIYLRWRHSDPWTAELIPCNENWELDFANRKTINTSKNYIDDEYKELESEVLEIIKKKFPETKFPD